MEKKTISERVFSKESLKEPIKFGEIDIELQPDDLIFAGHDDNYTNNSYSVYYLYVQRDRLETDEEFEKRKERLADIEKQDKELRFKRYIKYKEEFESVN